MKQIIAKKLKHQSPFGEVEFRNVPVMIADNISKKSFEESGDPDYTIDIDIGVAMEREIAKLWLKNLYPDASAPSRKLKPYEVYAIMVMTGLKAIAFAKRIGVSKGQLSKVLNGRPLGLPETIVCLHLLRQELAVPGSVKANDVSIALDEPVFDVRELRRA